LAIDPKKAKSYLARLTTRRAEAKQHIDRLETRLNNKSYTANAPDEVIADTKKQLESYNNNLAKLDNEIELFSSL
jgi:valyl-tRNA synthetase